MKLISRSIVLGAVAVGIVGVAQARDQIRIVGSSTVYPFASYVAEEFGATTSYPTPVIESTGSGGGMRLFCKRSFGDVVDAPRQADHFTS